MFKHRTHVLGIINIFNTDLLYNFYKITSHNAIINYQQMKRSKTSILNFVLLGNIFSLYTIHIVYIEIDLICNSLCYTSF